MALRPCTPCAMVKFSPVIEAAPEPRRTESMATPRTAFLILAHTQPEVLLRLCRALETFPVLVHVDAKSNLAAFRSDRFSPQVSFIENRVRVHWGGWSVVEATLRLIERALDLIPPVRRFVLLSGTCFPTRSVHNLDRFLDKAPYRNLIRAAALHEAGRAQQARLTRYWWFDQFDIVARRYSTSDVAKLIMRKGLEWSTWPFRKDPNLFRDLITPSMGSQWWSLDRDCAKYVVETFRNNPDLVEFFRTSFAPDEIAIHSVIRASRFAAETSALEPWPKNGVAGLANLHLIDPSLTKTFDEEDYPRIRSTECWFVRKIALPRSAALIERLEADLKKDLQSGGLYQA